MASQQDIHQELIERTTLYPHAAVRRVLQLALHDLSSHPDWNHASYIEAMPDIWRDRQKQQVCRMAQYCLKAIDLKPEHARARSSADAVLRSWEL